MTAALPLEVGVKVEEQLELNEVPICVSVHVVGLRVPEPDASDQATVPCGNPLAPGVCVSVTVAVQESAWPTTNDEVTQVTVMLVLSLGASVNVVCA